MLYSNLTTQQTAVIVGSKILKGGIAINDDVNINASGKSIVGWNWVANSGRLAQMVMVRLLLLFKLIQLLV